MRRDCPTEPLAADARAGRDGKDAVLKIVAGMLNVSFGELKRRDLQRRLRLLFSVSCVSASIVVVLAALAAWAFVERNRATVQSLIAKKNEKRADEQKTIAEANAQLANERRIRIRRNLFAVQIMRSSRDYDANNIARTQKPSHHGCRMDRPTKTCAPFEWYYLWRLAHAERHVLKGHGSPVTAVAWSPDGRMLASACEEQVRVPMPYIKYVSSGQSRRPTERIRSGAVRLWQADSGKECAVLTGHEGSIHALSFHPDGKLLASAGDDGLIRLWDAKNFTERGKLTGHQGIVYAVAFSVGGRWLASAGEDRSVRLWDLDTREEQRKLTGHGDSVFCVAFSRDGLLASGGYDETIRLWDAASGAARHVLRVPDGSITALAFHPDGGLLASVGIDQTVRYWDVASGKIRLTMSGMPNIGTGLSYSPDGRWLAVASLDQTVNVRAAITGQYDRRYRGHTGFVNAVAFSPNGQLLASAGNDHTVRIWDATLDLEEPRFADLGGAVLAVAFSPDGRSVAVASRPQPPLEKARRRAGLRRDERAGTISPDRS